MLIFWLCQALFGAATLLLCALTARAVLRQDVRAAWFLTLAGALALTFFLSLAHVRYEMLGVSLLAVIAGIVMSPPQERERPKTPRIAFDTTATRRRRD